MVKRHGNLGPRASRIYAALRRGGTGKTKAAKIANATVAGTNASHRKRRR